MRKKCLSPQRTNSLDKEIDKQYAISRQHNKCSEQGMGQAQREDKAKLRKWRRQGGLNRGLHRGWRTQTLSIGLRTDGEILGDQMDEQD